MSEIVDFTKQGGLIPAIIVDEKTNDILMLAYMNEESFQRTLSTGDTWFYSRSRRELWHKGETSGAYQRVKKITADCDRDTLLIMVDQVGGKACHTGARSCFFNGIVLAGAKDAAKTAAMEK
jgi:phosphoribosyl-AMP cyclohydrolase